MIITKSAEDAHKAKLLRWFGIDRAKKIANNWQAYQCRKMTFDIEVPGTKRHMADVSAAMGIVGLKHYEEVIAYRKNLFNIYKQRLSNIPGINYVVDGKDNTYWLCTVVVERRDDFARMLFEADVDTNVVQVRNDIYNIFGGERAELPVMNALEHKYLSLPLGMHVTEEEVNYICDKIEGGW
jgi:dTDP-4-amino-4,6-dideoxygalactose transaminase